MIDWATPESATAFLAPPSPPGAPHMGSLYTWSLLDSLRRTAVHLGEPCGLPQSWNMSSRRLESTFGSDPAGYAEYSRTAVTDAVAAMAGFGIEMSRTVALRDDLPEIRGHIRAIITEMADSGRIRQLPAEEKWCIDCQLALPPTATTETCFKCHQPLRLQTTIDWFLPLDVAMVLRRAAEINWFPAYAVRRLQALGDVHPLLRVSHQNRTIGVPSPLRNGDIVDPRLAGALGPSVLRRLGIGGLIVVVAGFDIQRKWLLPLLSANPSSALPAAVVNHGTLLDMSGRKLSRYSGASLADVPTDVEPCVVRAALLATPLGRDLPVSELSTAGASRLRQKVLNCGRFLTMQVPTGMGGVDLDAELDAALRGVEEFIRRSDPARGYSAFRRVITHDLSSHLIPEVRRRGLARHYDLGRITSLHQVFFGDDPVLQ
ncbi:MAG TPA: hypothetical protein VMV92_10470 [Streptosporangiaceae bacterium]|nr:hypothetical protein [Streptosporangiaceae bacterium]